MPLSILIWLAFWYCAVFGTTAVASGVVLIPAYRIHRFRLRRWSRELGPLARAIYFVPAAAVLMLGIYASGMPLLAVANIGTIGWLALLVMTLYLGLAYMRRAEDMPNTVLKWVAAWPGWFRDSAPEPSAEGKSSDIIQVLALPSLAMLVALADIVTKTVSFFANTPVTHILQLGLVAGSIGLGIHSLTAVRDEVSPISGMRKTLRYSRQNRLGAVLAPCLIVFLWAAGAAYEPAGDLRVVAASLPAPDERLVGLTLANQGQVVRIFRRFDIESRTAVPFGCLSAGFDIPNVGEYTLIFHIDDPVTSLDAVPPKQFSPQSVGQIRLALKPSAIGACSDEWTARVRIYVVGDDGRRSGTGWFKLRGGGGGGER
jgi:hypothetical protein